MMVIQTDGRAAVRLGVTSGAHGENVTLVQQLRESSWLCWDLVSSQSFFICAYRIDAGWSPSSLAAPAASAPRAPCIQCLDIAPPVCGGAKSAKVLAMSLCPRQVRLLLHTDAHLGHLEFPWN